MSRKKTEFDELRRRARDKSKRMARLNLMRMKDLVEELDTYSGHELLEVIDSPYLVTHRVRRLAEEIAEWRGDDRGVHSTFTRYVYWPDVAGVPYGGLPYGHLHPQSHRDPEDWLHQEYLSAMSDRRDLNLRRWRHYKRGPEGVRTLYHLSSGIDRALHMADNTVRLA